MSWSRPIALISLSFGLALAHVSADEPRDEMMELYGLFVDAVEQVESNYVQPVDRKQLLQNALNGMLEELDPHSAYFSESQWAQFRKQIEGSFTGIGVSVEMDPASKRLRILAPLPGAPAYEAGVLPGDEILAVDGKSTEGLSREKAVEALQGRPGTQVELKVQHLGQEEPQTIVITRSIIELPSVIGDRRKPDDSWDFLLDKDRKIGYVRITNFIEHTAADLKKALNELTAEGMRGLILDLRDNPGGLLSTGVEVADLFLEQGAIVTTKGRNTRDKVYEAVKEGTFTGFPMIVLINQHSASASEIVAASLQDLGRAKVVGQRSYGKGSVQNIVPLDNGKSILKLTVATYWRPSGKNIHRFQKDYDDDSSEEWGVLPDEGLKVELTPEQYAKWVEYRQRRDLISRLNPTGAPANDHPDSEATKDKERLEEVPDLQLEKALEVLRSELNEQDRQEIAEKAAE